MAPLKGMNFVRNQLVKYGWKDGKGLGRNETGVTVPVKPKLKFDNAGIGHDASEQFTYQWWKHAYDNAANNIQVTTTEKGVAVELQDDDLDITTKKYSLKKLKKNNSLEYGTFLKTSTLTQGGQIVSIKQDIPDIIEHNKPLAAADNLTDEDLFKICGGRTAHKGARHGMKLNGKLARIEEQERELLAKNKKNVNSRNNDNIKDKNAVTTSTSPTSENEAESKQKKKKSKRKNKEKVWTDEIHPTLRDTISRNQEDCSEPYKKRRMREKVEEDIMNPDFTPNNEDSAPEKKKKSRSKKREVSLEDANEETVHCITDSTLKAKKRKSKMLVVSNPEEKVHTVDVICSEVKKGKRKHKVSNELESEENVQSDSLKDISRNQKDCSEPYKKTKTCEKVEEDIMNPEFIPTNEYSAPEKKKKSRSKKRETSLEDANEETVHCITDSTLKAKKQKSKMLVVSDPEEKVHTVDVFCSEVKKGKRKHKVSNELESEENVQCDTEISKTKKRKKRV